VTWRGFEQHVDDTAQQRPGAWDDEDTNQRRDQ
jgi:hypothetical protein